MCGIVGYWDLRHSIDADALAKIADNMAGALVHRGPDDHGVWVDREAGIAFGHRRLSVIDISNRGHQPMLSSNDRYVLVYNGEIYNYRSLRRELEQCGHRFQGHSDTEVMITAFQEWGVETAIKHCLGMFAFAVWDRKQRQLWLGRDRLGEKPLYYGWSGTVFLFASELKALRKHPAWKKDIDRTALTLFMRHGYVPWPYSIYENIYKLPPASLLKMESHITSATTDFDPFPGDAAATLRRPHIYWDLDRIVGADKSSAVMDNDEAVRELERLIRESVARQLIADVPVGAFLSGGVDSSTIVALMQQESSGQVKTFSIGSSDEDYNEANFAKDIAVHLGTDHTELYVTPADAQALIPELPRIYDEPFADSSQIPTLLVSRLARETVTVALSGDGGDELFGGYDRYQWSERLWSVFRPVPRVFRTALGSLLKAVPLTAWQMAARPIFRGSHSAGARVHRWAELLSVCSREELYWHIVSHWRRPQELVVNGVEPRYVFNDQSLRKEIDNFVAYMMYIDTRTYLPDDILTKVDRASMSASLEVRVPMLDQYVVAHAWRIQQNMNREATQTKWPLRAILHKYVPRELVERPKKGFAIPIGEWLRNSLRDWGEELLDPASILSDGFLNPIPIREKWAQHLSGAGDWQYPLWNVLMFQSWLKNWQ